MNNKLGLGMAAIGRPQYINIRQNKSLPFNRQPFLKKGKEVLDRAYDLGVRYFDTAPGYGLAEELLIDWVEEKSDISIELASKWGYTYIANFDPHAFKHEEKEHSLAKLNEQWKQSKRLLPFLTSYQIHSATFATGVLENEEILDRLFEIKNECGIRIGLTVTGDNQIEVLKRAIDVSVEGVALFDVFQVTYNIFDQSISELISQFRKDSNRLVIKEALANGRVFQNERFPHYKKAYNFLNELASKYMVGVDAIALRFCIDSLPTYKVLSGADNEDHLISNLNAEKIILAENDLASLREVSIDPTRYWEERKSLNWN